MAQPTTTTTTFDLAASIAAIAPSLPRVDAEEDINVDPNSIDDGDDAEFTDPPAPWQEPKTPDTLSKVHPVQSIFSSLPTVYHTVSMYNHLTKAQARAIATSPQPADATSSSASPSDATLSLHARESSQPDSAVIAPPIAQPVAVAIVEPVIMPSADELPPLPREEEEDSRGGLDELLNSLDCIQHPIEYGDGDVYAFQIAMLDS